jgi:hypothetical protein
MTAAHKSESRAGARQVAEQNTDSTPIVPSWDDDSKALSTLKARFALHDGGHAVHELASGGFLVVATRWGGMSRECPDLSALAAFARQLGVRA